MVGMDGCYYAACNTADRPHFVVATVETLLFATLSFSLSGGRDDESVVRGPFPLPLHVCVSMKWQASSLPFSRGGEEEEHNNRSSSISSRYYQQSTAAAHHQHQQGGGGGGGAAPSFLLGLGCYGDEEWYTTFLGGSVVCFSGSSSGVRSRLRYHAPRQVLLFAY